MKQREAWMREMAVTHDPLRHLLLCTLIQTEEEVLAATLGLSDEQVWLRPHGLTPLGFHIRHIAESMDRLLTYAEGHALNAGQLEILAGELKDELPLLSLLVLLEQRLKEARVRIEALDPTAFSETRLLGRARIEVPLGTLLAHIAEHIQRHLGQIATTAKLLRAL